MNLFAKIFFLLLVSASLYAQNYTKEQTVDYVEDKMRIADPVFFDFRVGDNGETKFIWVNDGFYTEYRFNIRELEFTTGVNTSGDNIITLTCNAGTNNCLQRAIREDISRVGDKVTFAGARKLTIESIGGLDNVSSIKNALVYLKVLSITDNASNNANKKDPFLN